MKNSTVQPLSAANVQQKTRGRFGRDFKRNKLLYLMILPVVAFFLIFAYLPMGGIAMAFQDFDIIQGLWSSPAAGFKHFISFFTDPFFGRLLRNTLVFSLLDIVVVFPAPIILALLLSSAFHKIFKRTIQTAVYLPYFISMIVVCGIIRMLASESGPLGMIFQTLGLLEAGKGMLSDGDLFRGLIVVSQMWSSMGFSSVIYIAALAGIDQTMYEAAEIDGAGRWRKFWSITFPSILPTIMMMLILKISTLLNYGFEKIHLLYSPIVYDKADILSTYVYRLGVEGGQISYTTAIGLFNSVCGFVLLLTANAISRRVAKSGLF